VPGADPGQQVLPGGRERLRALALQLGGQGRGADAGLGERGDDLVGVAAMSRRGLHKAFIEHLGRTPGEELHRVRIERAKTLLAESNHKMEVLARMCGYQSANSFCVAFKQSTGMSPKLYRDSLVN